MFALILVFSAWAQNVEIAASKPGVVHVKAVNEAVFVPACRGVTWSVFSSDSGTFGPTAPAACGPSAPAIEIDQDGRTFEIDVPLGPLPKTGFHIVQATVVFGLNCRKEAPFFVAGCKSVEAVKGPQMLVRNRGAAEAIDVTSAD